MEPTDRQTDRPMYQPTVLSIELLSQLQIITNPTVLSFTNTLYLLDAIKLFYCCTAIEICCGRKTKVLSCIITLDYYTNEYTIETG